MPAPFHLAIPVHDLAAARAFYGGLLGCPEGRSSERWVDFDLYGHQLVAHLADDGGDRASNDSATAAPPAEGDIVAVSTGRACGDGPNDGDESSGTPDRGRVSRTMANPPPSGTPSNSVDGHDVPVPHFGVVLPWEEWEALAARLEAAGVRFVIPPGIRFAGQVGEQATMFFRDPSGNALEFKAFRDPGRLFARQ